MVSYKLDLDVGIFLEEFFQLRIEDILNGDVRCDNADGAGRLLAKVIQGIDLQFDFVEMRPDTVEQPFTGLGRRDRARGAGKQPDAKPRFELAHGMAQRGLRKAHFRGGLGKAPRSRHSDKSHKVVNIRT